MPVYPAVVGGPSVRDMSGFQERADAVFVCAWHLCAHARAHARVGVAGGRRAQGRARFADPHRMLILPARPRHLAV